MFSLKAFIIGIVFSLSSFFNRQEPPVSQIVPIHPDEQVAQSDLHPSGSGVTLQDSTSYAQTSPAPSSVVTPDATVSSDVHIYSDSELLALADNAYANGEVPLGDGKYTTTAPKKGYVYLCNARKDQNGGGAGTDGPWIGKTTWNFLKKITVSGSVSWSQATFSNTISGVSRILSGNGLPINHTTGVYPVQSSDAAYQYDRNPNSISAQTVKDTYPANPTYSDSPYCMGGEAGVMLTGVPLFNSFDAELRDAPAHELQDSCGGHPEKTGQYHYHSMSSCFKDIGVRTVLGYALDGFPITGPKVAEQKYLTTEDLDECHGLTSEIVVDGKKKTTYHYVLTQDFPYSVSCFRGKPSRTGPSNPPSQQQPQSSQSLNSMPQGQVQSQQAPMTRPEPPQEAKTACIGKSEHASCTVGWQMSGSCESFGSYLACIPANR